MWNWGVSCSSCMKASLKGCLNERRVQTCLEWWQIMRASRVASRLSPYSEQGSFRWGSPVNCWDCYSVLGPFFRRNHISTFELSWNAWNEMLGSYRAFPDLDRGREQDVSLLPINPRSCCLWVLDMICKSCNWRLKICYVYERGWAEHGAYKQKKCHLAKSRLFHGEPDQKTPA